METKFISKWCLNEGIRNYRISKSANGGGYYTILDAGHRKGLQISKKYIHDTLEEAKAKAEEMRLSKIQELKSEINKLENVRF